jgi:1-pyrroline-5-carboxylate dehydrogenase
LAPVETTRRWSGSRVAMEPTAVRALLGALSGKCFDRITTELFGPFQVIVSYGDDDLPIVLNVLERMSQHLLVSCPSNGST